MKLLITGDWQLDAHPPHDQVDPATQRSTRFQEGVEVIERMIDAGWQLGPRACCTWGTSPSIRSPEPLESTAAARLFDRLPPQG